MWNLLTNLDLWSIIQKYSYPNMKTKTYRTYVDGNKALQMGYYNLVLQSPYLKFTDIRIAIDTNNLNVIQHLMDLGVQSGHGKNVCIVQQYVGHMYITHETIKFVSDNMCSCDKSSHPIVLITQAMREANLDIIQKYDIPGYFKSSRVVEKLCKSITRYFGISSLQPIVSWLWERIDHTDHHSVKHFSTACLIRVGRYEYSIDDDLFQWIKDNVDVSEILIYNEDPPKKHISLSYIYNIQVLEFLWENNLNFRNLQNIPFINTYIYEGRLELVNWYAEKFSNIPIHFTDNTILRTLVKDDDDKTMFLWLLKKYPETVTAVLRTKREFSTNASNIYLLYKKMTQGNEIYETTKGILKKSEYNSLIKIAIKNWNYLVEECLNKEDFSLLRRFIKTKYNTIPTPFLTSLFTTILSHHTSTKNDKHVMAILRIAYHPTRYKKIYKTETNHISISAKWYKPKNTQKFITLFNWLWNIEHVNVAEYKRIFYVDNVELIQWLYHKSETLKSEPRLYKEFGFEIPKLLKKFGESVMGPKIFRWLTSIMLLHHSVPLKIDKKMSRIQKNKFTMFIDEVKHRKIIHDKHPISETYVHKLLLIIQDHMDLDKLIDSIDKLPE